MEFIKLFEIEELAQDFLRSPRVSKNNDELSITYDYELDTGDYGEKSIIFINVCGYHHVDENNVTTDMIEAYNSICEVLESTWKCNEMNLRDLHHYIIYFDGYGGYEVLAKGYHIQ